jgi:hypothetical protein
MFALDWARSRRLSPTLKLICVLAKGLAAGSIARLLIHS